MIKGLPISAAVGYVKRAMEQEQEKMVWELWSGVYPLMATGLVDFIPFDEFKRTMLKPRIKYSEKTADEIKTEMLAVVAKYERR